MCRTTSWSAADNGDTHKGWLPDVHRASGLGGVAPGMDWASASLRWEEVLSVPSRISMSHIRHAELSGMSLPESCRGMVYGGMINPLTPHFVEKDSMSYEFKALALRTSEAARETTGAPKTKWRPDVAEAGVCRSCSPCVITLQRRLHISDLPTASSSKQFGSEVSHLMRHQATRLQFASMEKRGSQKPVFDCGSPVASHVRAFVAKLELGIANLASCNSFPPWKGLFQRKKKVKKC